MSLSSYKNRCIEKYKIANPNKDIPINMGSKWTDIEEQALLDNIKKNLEIEEIAKKHSRTQGAINARLEVIAIRLYNQNMFDMEHIQDLTRLNEKTIREAIDKNKNKPIYEIKNNDVEILNLKEEIKELKASIKNIMDIDYRNKKDDIDELKKQIQNMLDINNIKNDIAELKLAITAIKS